MSDVTVYNRVLSPAEVSQLYGWTGGSGNVLPTTTTVLFGAAGGTPTLDLNSNVVQSIAGLSDNGAYATAS